MSVKEPTKKPCFCPAVMVKDKPTPHTHEDGETKIGKNQLLEIINRAKDKMAPLTWLEQQIKEL